MNICKECNKEIVGRCKSAIYCKECAYKRMRETDNRYHRRIRKVNYKQRNCKSCGQEVGKHKYFCLKCMIKNQADYFERTKERRKETGLEWRKKNKDKIQGYRDINKDKIKEYSKEYYLKNKEKWKNINKN